MVTNYHEETVKNAKMKTVKLDKLNSLKRHVYIDLIFSNLTQIRVDLYRRLPCNKNNLFVYHTSKRSSDVSTRQCGNV
jgi:hypothetical protein